MSMLRRELIEGLKAGLTHDPENISFYNRNALIKVFLWSLLQNKMICGLNILNIRPYPLHSALRLFHFSSIDRLLNFKSDLGKKFTGSKEKTNIL